MEVLQIVFGCVIALTIVVLAHIIWDNFNKYII